MVNVSAIDSQDVKRFFQSNGASRQRGNKAMRNGSCCGRRDGSDFPGAARSCLERHQIADLSDPHPARGIRARIAGARLSLSAVAIRPGFEFLRDNPAAGYDELRTLLGFFMLCQGAFGTFLFQDPSDYQVTGQPIGIGNASTTLFQLQRAIGATLPGGGFAEPILAPNLVSAIYFNGVVQNPAAYSVDPTTGLVTFETAPSNGPSSAPISLLTSAVASSTTNTISKISCIGCGS